MYGRPGVIYGFHGCDRRIGEAVLASHTHHLKLSKNDYDWLGHGIYFWEASPERGLEFARAAKIRKISQGKIRFPYVVGAVIELGNCLNLLDHAGLMEMRTAHQMQECIRGYFRVRELAGVNLSRWDSHPYRARLRASP
jgi:hypothetical protein